MFTTQPRVVTARPRMLCRTYTREMHCGIETRWRTVNKTTVKLALHLSVFSVQKEQKNLVHSRSLTSAVESLISPTCCIFIHGKRNFVSVIFPAR